DSINRSPFSARTILRLLISLPQSIYYGKLRRRQFSSEVHSKFLVSYLHPQWSFPDKVSGRRVHAGHSQPRHRLTIKAIRVKVIVLFTTPQNPQDALLRGTSSKFIPQAPNTKPAKARSTVTTVSVCIVTLIWLAMTA